MLEPLAKEAGLRIAAVYGGADIERQVKKLRRGVDVIIATPGRLIDLGDRGELSVADIETLVLDEADRMADMGFMPQVEWVLRRLEREHQTLLFSATLDGAVDRLVSRYLTDPVLHEVASPEHHRRRHGAPLPRGAPDGPGQGVCRHLPELGEDAGLRAHQARCRPAGRAAPQGRGEGGRHPRRPPPVQPGADPEGLQRGQASRPGGHRRRCPGPGHRHGGRGRPLRSARGPQGVPPPVGPDGPGRRGRSGGDPGPVEPGTRDRAHPDPYRAAFTDRGDLLQRPTPGRPGRVESRPRTERRAGRAPTRAGPLVPAPPPAGARIVPAAVDGTGRARTASRSRRSSCQRTISCHS